MKGQKISILRLSEAIDDNKVLRLDSVYFEPEAIGIERRIRNGNWTTLKAASSAIESFGAYALTNEFEYQPDGVPYLRCSDIKGNFIDFSNTLFITEQANALLSKSEIRTDMVLLTMSGSVGNVAVALDSWHYPINSNQDIAKIAPLAVDAYYLASFLSSKYGQKQIERLPVGSVQQHVFLWMIERLLISRLSADFERRISGLSRSAYRYAEGASSRVEEAEGALLSALGLADLAPPEPLAYSAKSADVFAAAQFDAQYFMPAKRTVRDALARVPGQTIGERFLSARDMLDPNDAPSDTMIRNYDVTDALQPILDDETEPVATKTIGSIKKMFKDGDVVISLPSRNCRGPHVWHSARRGFVRIHRSSTTRSEVERYCT